ncbi:ABC transporter permease [Pelagicoccus sp. SDUM812003]|uniref:ABC transporter permease n=1 Tax=Pelagicoccus sp. SDUM812003 TaxID=3041267 RepID=UPI00280ED8E4|nr:ABC transporter permease [Pelagicoccus sp. SDUM812003]MDQ8205414.1 ABC transporter permease [Pelagicoccus sp. SDUM812003]
MRLFLLLAFAGVASLGAGLFFQEFNLGASELEFIADFGFGSMTLLGSIMTVVVTAQLVYGEIEQRTLMPLLAKPVSRGEFLCGKLLGAWATICCFVGILALSTVLAVWIRAAQIGETAAQAYAVGEAVGAGDIALFAGLQCIRLMVLASVTAFFASYASSQLFAVFMGGFFWILGQLHDVFIEQAARGSAVGSIILKLAAYLVPDLRAFELGSQLIEGNAASAGQILQLAGYGLLYSVFYSVLAVAALKNREL